MSNFEFYEQDNNCILCGSDQLHTFKAEAFDSKKPSLINIRECKDCFFAWQTHISRSKEESIKYFEDAYSDKGEQKSKYFDTNVKQKIGQLEFNFIDKLPIEEKTLLDIGAGDGMFAKIAANRNWNVTSVDPAIDEHKFHNSTTIKTIKGTVDDIPNTELFDVVTMWDVIEHVVDPIELIDKVKLHIKKGGWLIIETGNYKSVDRLNGGFSHWMYQHDHRWYFSPDSIEKLLINSNFSIFSTHNKVLRPNWNSPSNYLGPSKLQLFKSIIKDPIHLARHLSKYLLLIKSKKWEYSNLSIFTIAARNI